MYTQNILNITYFLCKMLTTESLNCSVIGGVNNLPSFAKNFSVFKIPKHQ